MQAALKFADFSDAQFDRDEYASNCEIRHWAGREWLWPKSDRFVWVDIQMQWGEMLTLIEAHCPERRGAVQAGGCCGAVPWLLWLEGFEHVYTFEPEALNFYCLAKNIENTGVIGLHAGLGSKAGTCAMQYYGGDNVGVHFIDRKLTEGKIPMMRIDDLKHPHCDLICLDAESFETDIIAGAGETIARCKPSLITAETITPEMVGQLSGLGYALQDKVACDRHFLRI